MARDIEAAVEAVDAFVQRWESRIGTGAQTSDTIYCVTVTGFEGEAELRASDLRLILSANRRSKYALEAVVSALSGIPAPQVNDGENCVYRTSDDVPEDIFIALSHARSALTTQRGDGE